MNHLVNCYSLQFNPTKCDPHQKEIKSPIAPPPLFLNGCTLDRVNSFKHLVVILSPNVSWSPLKVRKLLALLFSIYMVVQPLFLVATPHFFDPTTSGALLSSMHRTLSKDIDLLESVQKFDLPMCTKQWASRNYHKTLFESLYCFQNCPQFVLFPSKHNYFVPFVRCVHHKDYLFRHPFPRTNPFSFFLYLQYISTWNI